MKNLILLSECRELSGEVAAIVNTPIPFPLKFRLETKLVPQLKKALVVIDNEIKALALECGAVNDEKVSWKFPVDSADVLIDQKSFEDFQKKANKFLIDEENAFEIDFDVKLVLFSDLHGPAHYPQLCKFIVE